MTESPSGFKLDADNCYVTSFLRIGQTSSMTFNEEGTFDYVVKAGTGVKEKGTINNSKITIGNKRTLFQANREKIK